MPKLSELIADRIRADVAIGEFTVHVVYRAHGVSAAQQKEFYRVVAGGENTPEVVDALTDLLLALVVEWDLTDDKGTPLPITREVFDSLSAPLRLRLLQGRAEVMSPNGTNGTTSPAT